MALSEVVCWKSGESRSRTRAPERSERAREFPQLVRDWLALYGHDSFHLHWPDPVLFQFRLARPVEWKALLAYQAVAVY